MHALAQLPGWFASLIVVLLGLAVGSFVNVIIYRVPRQMSIVTPGSRCPFCHTPLGVRDLVPVISFLLLRGRCRSCRHPLSLRYPVVEGLLGILFWVVWQRDGLSWSLPQDWAFVSAMVALGAIDLEHRLLPDAITYPGFVLAVGLPALLERHSHFPWPGLESSWAVSLTWGFVAASGIVIVAVEWVDYVLIGRHLEAQEAGEHATDARMTAEEDGASGRVFLPRPRLMLSTIALGIVLAGLLWVKRAMGADGPGTTAADAVVDACVGAAFGGGLLWILRFAYFHLKNIEAAGFGDIKMMMMVGAYLGLSQTIVTLIVASACASVIGLILIFRHRDRHIKIPYGFFLAIAATVTLLIGASGAAWPGGF